ncbi:MAG: ABC transporter ATP-binding protein [Nitrospirae bacterium]|nr:MAG: ABC transporter ATP-binding protein [Nitrospirota bacterium]
MIDVQHVTKQYGHHRALDDVTFAVEKGEIVAFLGPNGAGKTTMMRILTGYLPPTEGRVAVAGYDMQHEPLEAKRRIGYLPETPPLYLELTVHEYLTFVGRLKGLSEEVLPGRLDRVVQQTGLEDVRSRVIGHLSRGYRQRVGLAQALIHDPPLLILDEPTVGLDPNQIVEIRDLIKRLAGSHTILLSTHILPEATALCQRVIIIHRGRIAAVDTPEQLAARLRESEKLRLTVKTPPEDFADRLLTIPGVVRVFPHLSSSNSFLVEAELGHDIRDDLARFAVNTGVGLLELTNVSMSLEDVFVRLTHSDEDLTPAVQTHASRASV